jgi:polyphosphate kinase
MFYMVRVAGLKTQLAAGLMTRSSDGMSPREQLAAIGEVVVPLVRRHAALFCEDVMPALAKEGVGPSLGRARGRPA